MPGNYVSCLGRWVPKADYDVLKTLSSYVNDETLGRLYWKDYTDNAWREPHSQAYGPWHNHTSYGSIL